MCSLSPQTFVNKWRADDLKERQAYQQHFLDLCKLVGRKEPAELDRAVFAAYGWPYKLSDEEILERLLALNLARAASQGAVVAVKDEEEV